MLRSGTHSHLGCNHREFSRPVRHSVAHYDSTISSCHCPHFRQRRISNQGCICCLFVKLILKATELYDYLEQNGFRGELVLEDRDESPGFKMNDARTVGFPFCIVVGKASQDPVNPKYEIQIRKTGEK